jgi:hypothetical protein
LGVRPGQIFDEADVTLANSLEYGSTFHFRTSQLDQMREQALPGAPQDTQRVR